MLKCTFEDGGEAYHGLRHVVVDNIILKDKQSLRGSKAPLNQILLVKRAPHLTNGGKWGLVGGFVGEEETMEEATIRELKEETGYEGKVIRFVEIIDNPHRKGDDLNRQNIAVVYLVEAGDKVSEHDSETTEVKWFPLGSLPKEDEFAFDHYQIIQNYLKQKSS